MSCQPGRHYFVFATVCDIFDEGLKVLCLQNLLENKKNVRVQAKACAAGDSAAYERRASGTDDVVIVSALRTPITKVSCVLTSVWQFPSCFPSPRRCATFA